MCTDVTAHRLSGRPVAMAARVAPLAVAVGVFGLSFGVLAASAGLSPGAACAMSALVFAGGSQFAAVGVVAAGGSPLAAVASGLLLNARYLAFGVAMAPHLRGGPLRRAAAAFFVIDESVALALAEPDDRAARMFWWTGTMLGIAWIAGTAAGALAGAAIGDPRVYGLDAAFPAGFLALLAPLLDRRRARVAAAVGGVVAVALLPFAPPGVPVLAAAVGAAVALRVREPDPDRPAAAGLPARTGPVDVGVGR